MACAQRLTVIDATASDAVVSYYVTLLRARIAVVTPNKRACAADVDLYRQVGSVYVAVMHDMRTVASISRLLVSIREHSDGWLACHPHTASACVV
jgi:homoserine dehydrogenase